MLMVFDSKLAETVGLNESIALQQIHYCIESNRNSDEYFENERYWICKSVDLWQKNNFSFWSVKTIDRTFKNLVNSGLLITGCFNNTGLDRTKWYTINYDKIKDGLLQSVDKTDSDEMTKSDNRKNTKKTPDNISSAEVAEIDDISETITKIIYNDFNIKLTKKQTTALITACKSDLELFKNKVQLLKNQTGVENVIGWLMSALRDNFNQTEYSNKNIRKRKSKINNYNGHDWDYEELEELEQKYLENSLKEGQENK